VYRTTYALLCLFRIFPRLRCLQSIRANHLQALRPSLSSKKEADDAEQKEASGPSFFAFHSHNWGTFAQGALSVDTHNCVKKIWVELERGGLKTWLDESEMMASIDDSMCRGIDSSSCVLVYVTEAYIAKVSSGNARDNCKKEFDYSVLRKGGGLIIPVVLQKSCQAQQTWSGQVGMYLGKHLYIDFSDPSLWTDGRAFARKVEELKDYILRTLKATKTAMPNVLPNVQSRPESNGSADLESILSNLNLREYAEILRKEGAESVQDVLMLSDQELIELGLPRIKARNLLAACKKH
jgi:hypothetical protein